MSTFAVPGAQLSYEVSGSGPILLLIPAMLWIVVTMVRV